jgi:hypothetical protein
MRKPGKNYTPVEKVAILRRHLIDPVPVSDLYDEYQLSPTLFYLWQKQFFENGTSAFRRKNGQPDNQNLRIITALREKLQCKRRARDNVSLRSRLFARARFLTDRKETHAKAQADRLMHEALSKADEEAAKDWLIEENLSRS